MAWSKQIGYNIVQKHLLNETPNEVYTFLMSLVEKQMKILYKKSLELMFLSFLHIPRHASCHINLSWTKEPGIIIDDVYLKFCPTISFRDPTHNKEILFDGEAYVSKNKYVEEIISSYTIRSIYDVFNLKRLKKTTDIYHMIWQQVFVLYCLERKNVLVWFY